MRTILKYASTFLLIVLAACLLLLLAGLAPQDAVTANLASSMEQLVLEGVSHGVLYQGHPRSTLDNYSEAHILLHSYYMDTRISPAAIFENPGFATEDGTPADQLMPAYQQAVASLAPANDTYVRYWMGFRAFVRPLLALMNYMDARQLLLWSFLLLLGAVTLQLYRKTGSFWIALAFVFTLSQLNPTAITASYQFSTVFFLALTGMLLALSLPLTRISLPMLFFILGACTQYFDFYTAPLLSFGLPMLAFLLREQAEANMPTRSAARLRLTLTCFGTWMAAYVLMWLAKLTLTTVFTPYDAFADAFARVQLWLIDPVTSAANDASVPKALFYTAINLVDLVPLLFELGLLVAYLIVLVRRKPRPAVFAENLVYLLVALLPLVWIAITYQPSFDHAYFQYRSLGVTMFGGFLFLLKTGKAENAPAALD